MKKTNDNSKLAIQMLAAMVSGILVGLIFMAIEKISVQTVLYGQPSTVYYSRISLQKAAKVLSVFSISADSYLSVLCN